MMRRPIWAMVILVTAIVSLLVVQCGVKTTQPGDRQPFLALSDFPLDVGTRWIYHVDDTAVGVQDTVDVIIVAKRIDTSGLCETEWHYASRNGVFRGDTMLVYRLDDSIWFRRILQMHPHQKFLFPLSVGKQWGYYAPGGVDSAAVTAYEAIATSLGTYPAFCIETTLYTLGDEIKEYEIWLARGVGIVRTTHAIGQWGPTSITIWTLIAYEPA